MPATPPRPTRDLFRSAVYATRFDGTTADMGCIHRHATPEAAAACGQRKVRAVTPNTRDVVTAARYAAIRQSVLVLRTGADDEPIWVDWTVETLNAA